MKIKRIIEIDEKDFEKICKVANDTKSRLGIVPLASSIIVQSKPYDDKGEWIDYDNTFYKCPECGYLLEKCCPQCQTKVILPIGGNE